MTKHILLKVNLLVCFIIITGFAVITLIDYKSNRSMYMNNIEQISALTSEGICYQLESVFAKPVNISLTMAASSLLKNTLINEDIKVDEDYIKIIKEYLNTYKMEYFYDSVFLVSAKTSRYYNYSGVNRILSEDNPEDEWYYSFLESDTDYSLNIDNDQAAQDEITIFVNCRINNSDGSILGVVGVGLRFNNLQSLLEEYANDYDTDIYIINKNGNIEIAIDNSGFNIINFFDVCGYPELKDEILGNSETRQTLMWWLNDEDERNYVMAQFIPGLNWHLIVEHNTSLYDDRLDHQLFRSTLMAFITGLFVFIAITYIVNKYNKQLIMLTAAIEHEKRSAFRTATEQLYDDIYEYNITKNHVMDNHTKQYFESLGIRGDTPYDIALTLIAQKNIKEEYRNGYISTFSRDNILHEFEKGNISLKYDLLSNTCDSEYYWLRIMAHIYYLKENDSVCMFTYSKNIDMEKRKEAELLKQVQFDGLTNVYTKTATKHHIKQMLCAAKEAYFAFFIIDIDNFKHINDGYGHSFGDLVITEFSAILKNFFNNDDVIGRIGGDEFAVFLPVLNYDWAKKKAAELSKSLHTEVIADGNCCKITASIGVAITSKDKTEFETLYKNADTALYKTKQYGKNGYTMYDDIV